MLRKLRRRLSFANVTSLLALFVALGGTSAYAANEWNGSNIQDESLTGADIRGKGNTATVAGVNGSITGVDIGGQRAVPSLGQPYVDGSITGADIGDDTLQGGDIAESTLRKVPAASQADTAAPSGQAGGDLDGSYPAPQLRAPEAWHEVGTPDEPAFAFYSGGIGTVWDNFDRRPQLGGVLQGPPRRGAPQGAGASASTGSSAAG